MAKEKITPEEFAALARQAGLMLRPGSEKEMAAAYERLMELAKRVRAAQAEPAHVFTPKK
jgi:hypothetical protein